MVHLTYEGQGPITATYMLVGKGITYDTGQTSAKVTDGDCFGRARGVELGAHKRTRSKGMAVAVCCVYIGSEGMNLYEMSYVEI